MHPPAGPPHAPAGPVWGPATGECFTVDVEGDRRTVSALVSLAGPHGRSLRLLVRVSVTPHGRPVVLLAGLDGVPDRGVVLPVAALLAELPAEVGLPRDWLRHAFWGVLCPAGPEEPHGVLREVEVRWTDDSPALTGRERVLPEHAAAELGRERHLGPVDDAVAALTRDRAPAR